MSPIGERGPVPKETRARSRDTKSRETIVPDDTVRGYELTNRLLDSEDAEWHPFIIDWWEKFRRSPMAQRLVDDTQWMSLELALPMMQQYITGGSRGATLRFAEIKSVFTAFHITPADLLRAGLDVAKQSEDEKGQGGAPVANITEERRMRLVPDGKPKKRAPAKKRTTAKKK